jgi:hypothetical protein
MTRRRPDNSKMIETLGRDLLPLSDGIQKTADFLRSRIGMPAEQRLQASFATGQ